MQEMLKMKDDGKKAEVLPAFFEPPQGGSNEQGRHGFRVPHHAHAERDAMARQGAIFEWAVANRPGATPINGGRKRTYAEHHRKLYQQFAKAQRRRNPRFKLGRYTRPIPRQVKAMDAEAIAEIADELGETSQ